MSELQKPVETLSRTELTEVTHFRGALIWAAGFGAGFIVGKVELGYNASVNLRGWTWLAPMLTSFAIRLGQMGFDRIIPQFREEEGELVIRNIYEVVSGIDRGMSGFSMGAMISQLRFPF